MRVAPASSAFSTSSFTTLAGRSTTSPAAMRLTMPSESWRTGIDGTLWRIGALWRFSVPAPSCLAKPADGPAKPGERYSATALARAITSGGDA